MSTVYENTPPPRGRSDRVGNHWSDHLEVGWETQERVYLVADVMKENIDSVWTDEEQAHLRAGQLEVGKVITYQPNTPNGFVWRGDDGTDTPGILGTEYAERLRKQRSKSFWAAVVAHTNAFHIPPEERL